MIEIKHRTTNATLLTLDCTNLTGANLARADLIDGGQDARGYRFWAWCRTDGALILRGGCREWIGADAARTHYSAAYAGDGNCAECLARIEAIVAVATTRGWL